MGFFEWYSGTWWYDFAVLGTHGVGTPYNTRLVQLHFLRIMLMLPLQTIPLGCQSCGETDAFLDAGGDCVWSAARVRVLVPKGSFHLREAT